MRIPPDSPTTWLVNHQDAYLIHVFRDRLAYPDLRRKVIALGTEHAAATILIEDAGPGMNLIQDQERMIAQSAKIEAGHIYLPKDAPWLATFLRELLAFPNGANDDQVDSVAQPLIWMQRSSQQPIPIVPPFSVSRPRLISGQ